MISTLKKIIHPFYKYYHFWYHKKPRKYRYKEVYTVVQPTVFSPINTISTEVFLDHINGLDLKGKEVLELGCGSGIISLYSAYKGADVTASDINETAIDSLKKVSIAQGLEINCIVSDLFNNIPVSGGSESKSFDYIFINPPYYPKKPKNITEQAWFCGENFEYFKELFPQLKEYLSKNTNALMILSDGCDIISIEKIADQNQVRLEVEVTQKIRSETNFIYRISAK